MRTAFNKFSRGIWSIVEQDGEFYIYYHANGTPAPRCMMICKGTDTFAAMAECMTLLYADIFPEVKWDGPMQNAVNEALKE